MSDGCKALACIAVLVVLLVDAFFERRRRAMYRQRLADARALRGGDA